MSLKHPVPGSEIIDALEAGFADFAVDIGVDRLNSAHMRRARLGMPVFTLTNLATARAQDIGNEPPKGWKFLIDVGDGTVLSTEVYDSGGNAAPEVISLSHDHGNEDARRIEHKLESSTEAHEGDYELSVLRIPQLGLDAFRLKSLTGSKPDLAVPFLVGPRGIEAGRTYILDEFLNLIRPIAGP